MTDREKLIELVGEIVVPYFAEQIADHLLANGVAVQKWIPVTERLPEKHTIVLCYKDGQRRLGCYIGAEYGKGVAAFRHPKDQFAFGVTHWMPLPEPPESDPTKERLLRACEQIIKAYEDGGAENA